MSKRLQVVVEDDEYKEIQDEAAKRRQTVSEYVRQGLREIRGMSPGRADLKAKLDLLERTARYRFPAPGIKQMLAEIEKGRLG